MHNGEDVLREAAEEINVANENDAQQPNIVPPKETPPPVLNILSHPGNLKMNDFEGKSNWNFFLPKLR